MINATGVVIHTNLGRAPLSDAAIEAMRDAAHYSNLEFDLATGARGSRADHLDQLLRALTGAEAAVVVNNNAAALYLALSAHAQGRGVIVSRGQAVEIGGGFRIPDVLRQSGATLVEVGTTNRTRAADYRNALNDQTAALLRVHTSNFRVIGFTEAAPLDALREVADEGGALLIDDIGSGCLLETRDYGLSHEPQPQESVAAGSDLVLFSGDKLLGGPQAGIIVGREAAVGPLRSHPLMRVLRPDKTTIAALAATLQHYLRGEAATHIPVWRMIAAEPGELRERAESWRASLGCGSVVSDQSPIGGGSLPGDTRPTSVLRLPHPELAATLRTRATRRSSRAWSMTTSSSTRERCCPIRNQCCSSSCARGSKDPMPISLAAVVPHPPILVAEIGGARARRAGHARRLRTDQRAPARRPARPPADDLDPRDRHAQPLPPAARRADGVA